jgi:hypothetical protein
MSTMLLAFALGASAPNLILTILAIPMGISWSMLAVNEVTEIYFQRKQARRYARYHQNQSSGKVIILKAHKVEPKILMLPAPEKIAA